MTKQNQSSKREQPPPQAGKVEGEGSYTSTRRYNEHLKKTIETKDTEELGEQARRALEGEERQELEEAERRAKRGPKPLSPEHSKR
jgi:hypothetical protein